MLKPISRRRLIELGLLGGLGAWATRASRARAEANPLTTYMSGPLAPYVDELPRIPSVEAPGRLAAAPGRHRFHRDLPLTDTWGFGGQAYLGPTIVSRRGTITRVQFENRLGRHPLAADIDVSIMGVSALDLRAPRMVVHLHGGLTEPGSDGHALATIRPGGVRRHRYGGIQEATHLWYHDHALGLTRTNVFIGLAGHWLVRDAFDSGALDNPLGLPAGDFEIPLVLQDRIFLPDGTNSFRLATYVEPGKWEGAQAGDLAVVNGKVMPNLTVARCPYRFRLLNASNARSYALSLSNGQPLTVIGSDQGLFDAPVATPKLVIAPGERYDLLVDFSGLAPGERVELKNDMRLPFQFQIFGDPVITQVMQFTAATSRGEPRAMPARLRGDGLRPLPLPARPAPEKRRTMTVAQLPMLDRFPPALMNLNNLPFDTEDVELVRPGSAEQWDIVNLTTDDHPIHIHLARLRVLGRQPFDASAYQLANPRPELGTRYAPSADPFASGPATAPEPWEAGYKDTFFCPPGVITRVLVEWPRLDELDFEPDGPVQVAATVRGGAPTEDEAGARAMRFNPQIQDTPCTVRGYVWHCHVIDHEDHDMMLPLRVSERA